MESVVGELLSIHELCAAAASVFDQEPLASETAARRGTITQPISNMRAVGDGAEPVGGS